MISKSKKVMVGDQYYDIRCLSTDTKPYDVPNGSVLYEIDTGDIFLFDGYNDTWVKQPSGGGSSLSPITVEQVHEITGM